MSIRTCRWRHRTRASTSSSSSSRPMSKTSKLRAAFALVALSLVAASCQKTPPLDQKVVARSPAEFMGWRHDVGDELTRPEWSDFDAALQELKVKIMADGKATGSEGVDDAMRAMIDGKTIRDVLD